jgi:tetratricopeptide (TPR) repeat protein
MKEARERYERAKTLFDEGVYEQALIEFRRAFDLAPAVPILYNIARTAAVANRFPEALCAFEAYLERGGRTLPWRRKEEIKKEMEELRTRVASLEVAVAIDGATVTIDGEERGTSPLAEPVVLNAGRHVVIATKGSSRRRITIVLAGEDVQRIFLDLEDPGKVADARARQRQREIEQRRAPDDESQRPSEVWVGWLVTGVLTGAAVATGIAAVLSSSKLGDLRQQATAQAELDDEADKARGLAIAADVLGASALVAGAVTLYFTIAGVGGSSDKASDKTSDKTGVQLQVAPTSVGVRGAF